MFCEVEKKALTIAISTDCSSSFSVFGSQARLTVDEIRRKRISGLYGHL